MIQSHERLLSNKGQRVALQKNTELSEIFLNNLQLFQVGKDGRMNEGVVAAGAQFISRDVEVDQP